MNTTSTIMFQIAERDWTSEALHCACLLARKTSAKIALVKMIPVQHGSWLGTELGYMNFSTQEWEDFDRYQATVEDYGVEFTPLLFQYVTLPEAIAQAAEQVNAEIVFAHLPKSHIPLWSKCQHWLFSRQLEHQHRQWTEQPVYNDASTDPIESVSESSALEGHLSH